MSLYLSSGDNFLVGGRRTTNRLVGQEYPVQADPQHGFGSWVVTTDGDVFRPMYGEWMPFFPKGSEILIASWSPTPPGWYDVPITLGPEYEGRRVITNDPQ